MNSPIAPTGFQSVPPGKIAAIVTSLEMAAPPANHAVPTPPSGIRLRHVERPALDWYRQLFRKVGEDWLWFSRLRLDDAALATIVHDPAVAVHVLERGDREVGILELDFRESKSCEITFFGVSRDLVGQGIGGYLMREAIARAWCRPIERLWVHTCTLDHPAALAFYRRSGFRAYRQQVEIADDPRVRGELPRTAAPQIPLID